jgi:DNA-binding LytR/AlgR family response regulator
MEELLIALCEDDADEQKKLISLIQSGRVPAKTTVFDSGEALLGNDPSGSFDLVLMDIYMDGISGVEAARRIRNTDPEIPVAFVTTSKEHALDGYRLNVNRYLEKPVSQKAMDDVLLFALDRRENPPGITILVQGRPLSLPVRRLLYVEQKAHYLTFHLLDNKTIQAKGKLDELMPQLEAFPFFRCHKSYLANLAFVTGIDRELMVFHMRGGEKVYIRRENFKKARQAWELFLFEEARKGIDYE